MATTALQFQDVAGYVKCGEVLKSTSPNNQYPFVLKCIECNEIIYILETFAKHIQEQCNRLEFQKEVEDLTEEYFSSSESEGNEKALIKVETIIMEVDDPLVVNHEANKEIIIKEDINAKNNNLVSQEEIEDNSTDTDDDFNTDDDNETDEDVIPSKRPKKGKKSSLSPATEQFTKSRQNMKILIELYKNQPNLWNKELPMYRFRDKKRRHLEEIATDLNNKIDSKYTWKDILKIIRYIYKKHREDYKRLCSYEEDEDCNQKETKYKGSWFYNDLYFLRPKSVIELKKLNKNLPDLSAEQVIQIIGIYRDQPHLWNSELIEYICSNKRQNALLEMSKSIETKMNIKIEEKALEDYIRSIHSYFSKGKCLRKNNTTKKSNNYTDEYYEHLLFLYDHEGPFNCTACRRAFNKPLVYRVHKSNHDESIPLTCSQCNKEFKTIPTYTVHAKRHFEDLDFVCEICKRKFVAYADLRVHTLTHSGERPYCCEKCGASFRNYQYFKSHQRRHEKRYTHQCGICSKGYYSKASYDDHMNSHLNIRSHICPLCGRGFITRKALKTHAVTHEEARNHACKLCGKTFKLKIGVLQHMRTHGTRSELDENH